MSIEKIAVIGTGVMGRNHARTIHEHPENSSLSYVVDVDLNRAMEIKRQFGTTDTQVAVNIEELDSDNIDGAIIASPSHLHASQSVELLNKGIHVLVEKPAALTLEDAAEIEKAAQNSNKTLLVGHIELFNPVIHELQRVLSGVAIKSLRFERLGLVTDSSRLYHDVINDLMLHDIALANQIIGKENPIDSRVISAFARNDTHVGPDPAEAVLMFDSGIDAHFRASRAYQGGKVRKVEVETDQGVYLADLLSRQVTQLTGGEGVIAPNGTYVRDSKVLSFFPGEIRQPLELEHEHFIRSIRGDTTPEEAGVSIYDATRILRITQKILSLIQN